MRLTHPLIESSFITITFSRGVAYRARACSRISYCIVVLVKLTTFLSPSYSCNSPCGLVHVGVSRGPAFRLQFRLVSQSLLPAGFCYLIISYLPICGCDTRTLHRPSFASVRVLCCLMQHSWFPGLFTYYFLFVLWVPIASLRPHAGPRGVKGGEWHVLAAIRVSVYVVSFFCP